MGHTHQKKIIYGGVCFLVLGGMYALWTMERGEGGMHASHGVPVAQHENMHGAHPAMTVASEREFVTEMIPHHEEAVATAGEVLARGGVTSEVRALAEGIITAQEKEIASLKKWHEEWYGEVYRPSGRYIPMMRDLSLLQGGDLDRAFLEDMILHHRGAIEMAESVLTHTQREEVKSLAQAITESQSEEISLMQSLLQSGSE